ncbi:MAG TPA: hypothetical protein VGL00_02455 [Terracidiphilus sp.]
MPYRSKTRTIADLRILLRKLERNRHAYNGVSLAQLTRILRRRIDVLSAELRGDGARSGDRRAA